MGLPQEWPRQKPNEEVLIFDSAKLNDIYKFLEALANSTLQVWPPGRGTGQVIAAPKNFKILLNLTPTNGATPYVLGSTVNGSNVSGPGGANGPWGGSGDLAGLGDGSTPFTDTWHRDRKPRTPGDVQTDCVDIDDGWRYHALTPAEGLWVFHATEGSGDHGYFANRYQSFKRTRRYDDCGLLSVTAESYGPIVTDATFNAS